MQKTLASESRWTESRSRQSLRSRYRDHLRQKRLERDVQLEFQEQSNTSELLIPWAIALQRMLSA